MKIKETYKFTHNDIDIFVRINYLAGKISFVTPKTCYDGRDGEQFVKKEWIFIDRGADFMNSWLDILEAMKMATKDAKKKLEEYQKTKDDKELEDFVELEKIINKQ